MITHMGNSWLVSLPWVNYIHNGTTFLKPNAYERRRKLLWVITTTQPQHKQISAVLLSENKFVFSSLLVPETLSICIHHLPLFTYHWQLNLHLLREAEEHRCLSFLFLASYSTVLFEKICNKFHILLRFSIFQALGHCLCWPSRKNDAQWETVIIS